MTSHDIYPLAQRLYALIPARLRQWTGGPGDPDERDRLANTLFMELKDVVNLALHEFFERRHYLPQHAKGEGEP